MIKFLEIAIPTVAIPGLAAFAAAFIFAYFASPKSYP